MKGGLRLTTLVNWELHCLLIIGHGSKCTFLQARHCVSAGNDRGEDIAFHGDTKTERNNIQEKEVGCVGRCGLAGENSCGSESQLSEHQETGN